MKPVRSALLLAFLLTANAAERPNVLVIVGDDMGYADVGFHGVKDIPTPHLDALAAAGVEAKPEWKLEGVNLLPYLAAETTGAPHDVLCWRFGQQMAIRVGDWKLVRYDGTADTNDGQRQSVTEAKLYNLASDLHEDQDLAQANPTKVQELQTKWNTWNEANVAPLWGDSGKGKGKQAKKNLE